jgi:hypothetical protein
VRVAAARVKPRTVNECILLVEMGCVNV